MDFKRSIAKVLIDNQFSGTAWLINLQFAITAEHCVRHKTQNITLEFNDGLSISVQVIVTDKLLDVALLKLNKADLSLHRLEISKPPLFSSGSDSWKAHGYPAVLNDRFSTGISIGGKVRNFKVEFDNSPAIQLVCDEGVNEIDFDDPYLQGISGAPVILEEDKKVVGMIRYAPPEFGEKIIIATPIECITEKFQQYLPTDLHIFDNTDFGFDFFDESLLENRDDSEDGIKLKDFQKKIYTGFDDLGIKSFADYQILSKQEQLDLNTDILTNMTALGSKPEDLLDLTHLNTRFTNKLLSTTFKNKIANPWDVLHRKTAVYADHSVIGIAPIRQYDDPRVTKGHGFGIDKTIEPQTINLLIQHRSLIELGKMSVVPEIVKKLDYDHNEQTIFNVEDLATTKVDLSDPVVRQFFLKKGKMLHRKGIIALNSPHGGGLPLDEIMEVIEAQSPEMYDYFQTHLKKLMYGINPENDTQALKYGLQAVDAGIQELDIKYQSAQKKLHGVTNKNSGVLAIGLYGDDANLASYLEDTFSNTALSSMVSFIPESNPIPDDIRQSPFFIPWLIHHRS